MFRKITFLDYKSILDKSDHVGFVILGVVVKKQYLYILIKTPSDANRYLSHGAYYVQSQSVCTFHLQSEKQPKI